MIDPKLLNAGANTGPMAIGDVAAPAKELETLIAGTR